ncbi:hypothetical protein R1flu_000831 [Riccia fluitans]|uniref:Glycosyl transferase family 28 C-terminal domain-containing protein n=1 Tax=Riccia fluitans TaxID=41844 RepID=A0ABD1Y1X3_9MARC
MKTKGMVFVTVGSTLFDALVEAVCQPECLATLRKLGYTSLMIQLGKGNFIPGKSVGEAENIDIEYFTYKPNVAEYINSAALVISHAGSGSVFETLRAQRPLVVVVNTLLMDNHQSELADELAERKFLYTASPETLVDTLRTMRLDTLVPYQSTEPSALAGTLDQFLGFSPA